MLHLTRLVLLLVLHIFVGPQEGMELVIEVDLGVLHGHEHLQLLFELQKGLVRSVLLQHEVVDVGHEHFHIAISPLLLINTIDMI